ncbi:MAG: YitT family protein [Coprobacter sp.]|nr:YitT family protein [Coprobacter sp.]
MNYSIKKILFEIKDYILITFGLFLYTFGWTGFLLPEEITTGGVTGIAALIFFGYKIPVAVSYVTINVTLLILAIKIIGFQFCIRTIFGVTVTASLLSVLQSVITEPIINNQPFMSCVIGGMLCGIGVGIVFTHNGSTGGTDIIAAIVNKYREISMGRTLLYCDVLIISSSYLLFHSIEKIVFGLATMVIMTYMCDMVINGIRQSIQILIFSEKYEEIADHINKDINRGVTILEGMGWYSKQPKKVICVLAKRSESVSIFRTVKSIDPNAFISQSNVVGVYGEGFDKIKA